MELILPTKKLYPEICFNFYAIFLFCLRLQMSEFLFWVVYSYGHPKRNPTVQSTVSKLENLEKLNMWTVFQRLGVWNRPQIKIKLLDMDNPLTATTQLVLKNYISQSSVVWILKNNKYKLYKAGTTSSWAKWRWS